MRQLADFRMMTFDTYGTLIDWETGLLRALEDLRRRAPQRCTNDEALEQYGEIELRVETDFPTMLYSDVLAAVYCELAERWGAPATAEQARAFATSIRDWPAFSDTTAALQYLQQHCRIATLTNCDRRSYEGTVAQLRIRWDAIYTAQDVGSYKPSLENFRYMLRQVRCDFGIEPHEILHVAQSLTHDHVPATQLEIANAWIDRRHGLHSSGATVRPHSPYELQFTFTSMAELAEAHRRSLTETSPGTTVNS